MKRAGTAVRRRRGLRKRQLRRRRLLLIAELRELPVVRGDRHRRARAAPFPPATSSRTAAAPPAPPCGFIGTCDGNGACRQAPASTSCGVASCSGATFTAIGHCNGNGGCDQTATATCAPYKCGPAACLTVCAADADCTAGLYLPVGLLHRRSPTATRASRAPSAPAVTVSRASAAGPPAARAACPARWLARRGPASPCQPTGSTQPAVCVTTGSTTCGMSGRCNGSGQCAFHPAGTPCGAQSCMAADDLRPQCATAAGPAHRR